jgi:hypothetical protein
MKIKITKGDLAKAQKAYKKTGSMCCSCLVFQALKRKGFKVKNVFLSTWQDKKGAEHHLTGAGKITFKGASEWGELVGETFETVD